MRPPVPVVAPLNGATPGRIAEWLIMLTLKTSRKKNKLFIVAVAATCWEVVRLCSEDDVSQ